MEKLSEVELFVNERIRTMPWCECDVIPSKLGSFSIGCGEDIVYAHTIEITFNDVLFTHCRYDFHIETEQGLFCAVDLQNAPITLNEDVLLDGYKLFSIREEFNNRYYIAAKEIVVSFDTVFRYNRPNLKPEERIASWINKDHFLG